MNIPPSLSAPRRQPAQFQGKTQALPMFSGAQPDKLETKARDQLIQLWLENEGLLDAVTDKNVIDLGKLEQNDFDALTQYLAGKGYSLDQSADKTSEVQPANDNMPVKGDKSKKSFSRRDFLNLSGKQAVALGAVTILGAEVFSPQVRHFTWKEAEDHVPGLHAVATGVEDIQKSIKVIEEGVSKVIDILEKSVEVTLDAIKKAVETIWKAVKAIPGIGGDIISKLNPWD